jgi:OOP family OmpA-OmpF porin
MKTLPTLRLLSLAGIGSLIAASSFAQQDGSYYYGGLSVGESRARVDEARYANSLLGGGQATTVLSTDSRGKAFKLFGGYQMNRYFGVEGGFFDLGQFGFQTSNVPAGTLNGQIKVQGVNLDVVGTVPLTDSFSAFGRAGVQFARTRDSFDGTAVPGGANRGDRGANPKIGLGLQYDFSPSMSVRAEAEHYRLNDAVGNHSAANVYSVSVLFPFGRTPAPAPRAMAAPAYVAPAPAPAPVVAEAPAPAPVVAVAPVAPPVVAPAKRRVSFSAESLFTFDKSAVKPEGKAALDSFSKEVEGTQFDKITVEGHTDRLGSTAYNQRLSQERAEAVKGYLVTEGKVDATKISAVGMSESAPVTKPEDCVGTKASPKLIACLQPDRRVEVEVTGTR